MISGPSSNGPTVEIHYQYDAWNRLVAVYADNGSGGQGDLMAKYAYDGRNRRIEKSVTAAGGGVSDTQYYYDQQGQVVEARSLNALGETTAVDQYVWDQTYVVFVAEGTFCEFAIFGQLAFGGPTKFGVSRWAKHAV